MFFGANMKTIIYGKFKYHIIHAPLVCSVLFFLNCSLYCVFNLTFTVLKILWVLGKKGALARWNLNQQQKRKKKEVSLLWFHKNVSMLLKLVSSPFVSFIGWCGLSRACLDPGVPTGTLLLVCSLDCPALLLCLQVQACCLLLEPFCYWDFQRAFYVATVSAFPVVFIPPPPYLVLPSLFHPAVGIPSQELIFLLCSLG